MKKLVIVLLVLFLLLAALLGGLAYGDLRLRGLAEAQAEQKLAEALPQASGIEVTLDGFPFTLGVLLDGKVKALHVKLAEVKEAGLAAQDLSLDVEEISLDKDALIDEVYATSAPVEPDPYLETYSWGGEFAKEKKG